MAVAAYPKKINVSTDGATWSPLAMKSPTLETPTEVLDTTNFAPSPADEGWMTRIYGLHDWSIGGDVLYAENDTALNMVKNAKLNRTVLHVQYLPLGTVASGFEGKVLVESFGLSGDVSGVEMVSISLQGTGALVPAT